MDRIRLTKRASRERVADAATPQTAIDLGKNRTYHKIDEYHTFEQTVNHELPDMRHEWKDDKRGDANFGIPKYAKVYMAAKKATKLATLLLGKNADEASVEKQARAFMRMGDRALTASLNIYAECNGDDCKEAPATTCNTAAEEAPATTCNTAAEKAPAEAPAVEEKAEEAPAPAVQEAPATTCNVAAEEAPAVEEKAEEAPAEAPAVEEKAEEADIEVDEVPAEGGEISFDDDTVDGPAEADDELSGVFDDDEANEEGEEETLSGAVTTRKAGVKKLAGQPTLTRVASKNADELSALWDKWTNPDVR